jgi:L-amino acid N-acyltransferase YncA
MRNGLSVPPDDITLRDVEPEDIRALAELHVRAFDQTHGPGPDVSLRERQWREKLSAPDALLFCIVLEIAGRSLIGFASGTLHRSAEPSAFRGVLDKIYLLREFHRQGLGRRLFCAAAQRFLERGVDSMLLFGDANSPTNGFHEAMLGERLYDERGAFHGGYGWRDLRKLGGICGEHHSSA